MAEKNNKLMIIVCLILMKYIKIVSFLSIEISDNETKCFLSNFHVFKLKF